MSNKEAIENLEAELHNAMDWKEYYLGECDIAQYRVKCLQVEEMQSRLTVLEILEKDLTTP